MTVKTNNLEREKKERRLSKRQKETIPVDIRRSIYENLDDAAKERNQPSIRQFVNYLLDAFLKKEKFIKMMYPDMQLYAVGKSSLFVRYYDLREITHGNELNDLGITEIRLFSQHNMFCTVDKTDNCRHINFVSSLPEIYVLLNEAPMFDKEKLMEEEVKQMLKNKKYDITPRTPAVSTQADKWQDAKISPIEKGKEKEKPSLSKEDIMLTVSCREVGMDCDHVIKGETEQEIMKKAEEHAIKDHGYKPEDIPTPELREKIRQQMSK